MTTNHANILALFANARLDKSLGVDDILIGRSPMGALHRTQLGTELFYLMQKLYPQLRHLIE